MRTTHRLQRNGMEVDMLPWVSYPARLVSVEMRPNSDPNDPSDDELVMTYEVTE